MPTAINETPSLTSIMRKQPALMHVGAALAMFEGGQGVLSQVRSWYTKHLTYTVKVHESDRIYDAVIDWLMESIPAAQQRNLIASTSSGRRFDSSDGEPKKAPLRVAYDDHQTIPMVIEGHRVKAMLQADEVSGGEARTRPDRKIEFSCRTKAAQQAVLRHLQAINEDQAKTEPTLWMTGMWGDWQRRSDLPLRTLDSVVIPPEQKAAIVQDLREFLNSEERYNELAIPWHRGYMFHGPPGTGKTSLAKALATEFKMDLWYVSLADLKETSDLLSLLRSVRPRSILLLEDIDIAKITHDRDAEGDKVSMAALLNALDGVGTPHGLISIMTTNHLEKLDEALTRPGRMDRIERIELPSRREVQRLFYRFYGKRLPRGLVPDESPLSQAEVSEVLKRNLDDPDAAQQALMGAFAEVLSA